MVGSVERYFGRGLRRLRRELSLLADFRGEGIVKGCVFGRGIFEVVFGEEVDLRRKRKW